MKTKICSYCNYTGPVCAFKSGKRTMCKPCYNKYERERRKRKREQDLIIRTCDTCGLTMTPGQTSSSYSSRCTSCYNEQNRRYKRVRYDFERPCSTCERITHPDDFYYTTGCYICRSCISIDRRIRYREKKENEFLESNFKECLQCNILQPNTDFNGKLCNRCRIVEQFRECHVCGVIKYIPWNFTYSADVCDQCDYIIITQS